MLAGGECFGTGMIGHDIHGESIRRGTCPECGRLIMVVGESDRLARHLAEAKNRKAVRLLGQPSKFARIAAKLNVGAWIGEERRRYAERKYGEETDAWHKLVIEMRDYGLSGEWMVFIGNYLKRAELLGLDTHAGRQAMGKCIVTMTACLEAAVEVHGPMPQPGLPSGEVREWDRNGGG